MKGKSHPDWRAFRLLKSLFIGDALLPSRVSPLACLAVGHLSLDPSGTPFCSSAVFFAAHATLFPSSAQGCSFFDVSIFQTFFFVSPTPPAFFFPLVAVSFRHFSPFFSMWLRILAVGVLVSLGPVSACPTITPAWSHSPFFLSFSDVV